MDQMVDSLIKRGRVRQKGTFGETIIQDLILKGFIENLVFFIEPMASVVPCSQPLLVG